MVDEQTLPGRSNDMPDEALMQRAAAIALDRSAGASELLARLLPLLDDAIPHGRNTVLEIVRRVCGGQPAMASLWNACAASIAEFETPGRFARAKAQMERAPQALVRCAVSVLLEGRQRVTRVLTVSCSSTVGAVLRALAAKTALQVTCAESIPGGEGRRMQEALTRAGAEAHVVPDALLTTYLPDADAVIVGADAISRLDWTNKAGTFAIAAAAAFTGTPVYVCATRDKAQPDALRTRLTTLPRHFEATPLELATLVLTDVGPLTPADVERWINHSAAEVDRILTLL